MKTLVLIASPNKEGNTNRITEEFLKSVKGDMDVINVYEKNISPCIDCKYCQRNQGCSIQDDMCEIYDKVKESDNIVIASPMYFGHFPSPIKAVIDRFQIYWSKKYVRKEFEKPKAKNGILIVTAGSKWDDMFLPIEATVRLFFLAINAKMVKKIYVTDTDKLPVRENEKILEYAYICGEEISRL